MSITAKCDECGTAYRVKDEAAGKSMRCKACGETFSVPRQPASGGAARKPKPESDEDDFLSGLRAAASSERNADRAEEEEDDFIPSDDRPVRSSRPKRAARREKSSSGGGSGGAILRVIGGVFGGLTLLGILIRVAIAIGANGFGVSWQSFTPPNGAFSVDVPTKPMRSTKAAQPGVEMWEANTRNMGTAVGWGQMPPEVQQMAVLNPEMLYNAMAEGARAAQPGSTLEASVPSSLGGVPGKQFTIKAAKESAVLRVCLRNGTFYIAAFSYRSAQPPKEADRFFNSFTFTGGNPAVPPAGAPMANPAAPGVTPPGVPPIGIPPVGAAPVITPPGMTPPGLTPPNRVGSGANAVDNRPYLERRREFTTNLFRRDKAPQSFVTEAAPENVTEVTYPSGALKLKGWVYRPPTGGPKFPALVYFHGGWAFGQEDLSACDDFKKAGYVVFAPALRGENGNPGNFELMLGEVDDAKAACQWLAGQDYVDAGRIFTFGHSAGGGISAMLSLMDNVPIRHGGSAGGLYDVTTFDGWSDIVPFVRSNPAERQLRVLVGNIKDMQRKHYAYLGDQDFGFHGNEAKARAEGGASSQLAIERVPGNHDSSLPAAMKRYLAVIQANP
ncbi:MAG: prolyl oligopeptidase family serine peptidase [Planctomycetaceae bacterium]|nr:prolyl oligopeptidase family serine peptidase [Planctomycetaceae bacterium]